MGNAYSGYSESRMETVQDEILQIVASIFKSKQNKNVNFTRRRVQISDKTYIQVIECTSDYGLANKKPLVITHGYGLGGVTFAGNMASLALSLHRRIIAVDWLGLASSARPDFLGENKDASLKFFLDAFEVVRQKEGLRKFDFVGHGLGAYLQVFFNFDHDF